jgi:hypothetical protein
MKQDQRAFHRFKLKTFVYEHGQSLLFSSARKSADKNDGNGLRKLVLGFTRDEAMPNQVLRGYRGCLLRSCVDITKCRPEALMLYAALEGAKRRTQENSRLNPSHTHAIYPIQF